MAAEDGARGVMKTSPRLMLGIVVSAVLVAAVAVGLMISSRAKHRAEMAMQGQAEEERRAEAERQAEEERRAEAERQAEIARLRGEFDWLVNARWTMADCNKCFAMLSHEELSEIATLTHADSVSPEELVKRLVWVSSSAFTYPFKDAATVMYHEKVLVWAARKNGIRGLDDLPSFIIERRIMEFQFAELWDRLSPEQRGKLLDGLNTKLSDDKKLAIAAGSGAAALTALSGTVAFTGFAFYTTMSATISAVAAFWGVTLPFSVYTTASGTVALLSGPVGWGIALIAGTGAAVWTAAPDEDKTTAFILALHMIKAKRASEIAGRIKALRGEVPQVRGMITM